MSATEVVVTSDHVIPDRPPIEPRPGDRADVGEQSTDWPAFVLVTTASGSGWVPERYLDDERPTATVLHPYDTRELPASAGERLTVIEDDAESGWSWCANTAGRTGWVPHEVLR
ncbi:SH3 domain-containing protein [Xylanimonas sp. McL0601]|uniref:SH3 domain-containing protein n=1 Tax=Xylanimonas sp. McL0601 TaxID=3414739 RepID=UPI003CE6FCEE